MTDEKEHDDNVLPARQVHDGKILPAHLMMGRRGVDERRREVLRYKELAAAYAVDLGGTPSTGQWALLCRAASLEVLSEQIEVKLALGQEVDVIRYTTLCNALVRVLGTLGLVRRPKDINPRDGPLEGHAAVIDELAAEEGGSA